MIQAETKQPPSEVIEMLCELNRDRITLVNNSQENGLSRPRHGAERGIQWNPLGIEKKYGGTKIARTKRRPNRTTRRNKNLRARAELVDKITGIIYTDRAFGDILVDLYKLGEREEHPELGIRRPTQSAFKRTLGLFIAGRLQMESQLPSASVSTDDEGGVHVHWTHKGRELTLVIPGHKGRPAYLFHESKAGYGVEENVSENHIISWLNWLSNG